MTESVTQYGYRVYDIRICIRMIWQLSGVTILRLQYFKMPRWTGGWQPSWIKASHSYLVITSVHQNYFKSKFSTKNPSCDVSDVCSFDGEKQLLSQVSISVFVWKMVRGWKSKSSPRIFKTHGMNMIDLIWLQIRYISGKLYKIILTTMTSSLMSQCDFEYFLLYACVGTDGSQRNF